jgi:membrane-bound ClpP family serine protease
MSVILGLLLLAAVLIGFEVILPGGILGFVGLLVFLGASGFAGAEYGAGAGTVTFFGGGVFLGFLFFMGYKWFPETALGKKFIMGGQILGASNKGIPDELVGQTCQSLTPLRPTGLVMVDGNRYEAISKSGFIDSHTQLVIKSKDNYRVVVEPATPQS